MIEIARHRPLPIILVLADHPMVARMLREADADMVIIGMPDGPHACPRITADDLTAVLTPIAASRPAFDLAPEAMIDRSVFLPVSLGSHSRRGGKVRSRRCIKDNAIVPDGQRCPMCGGKRTQ